MRLVPERITMAWIETLTDADLLSVEKRTHAQFALLERREKRLRGGRYELARAPAELLDAWDRWSRINSATRERSLHPRREPVAAGR